MIQWIFALLVAVAPPGRVPDRETEAAALVRYQEIAEAVAETVEAEDPLFGGPLGRHRTGALLVSVAFFESGLRLDVDQGATLGDHGRACGLWQIQAPPQPCAEFVRDRRTQASHALALMRRSFAACRSAPVARRLAAFASGRCSAGHAESEARILYAQRIFARRPPP